MDDSSGDPVCWHLHRRPHGIRSRLARAWRNRLNGDPRQYPVELRSRRWAQWNMTMWNLDHPRVAELRTFGIVVAVLNAILLTGLLLFTC